MSSSRPPGGSGWDPSLAPGPRRARDVPAALPSEPGAATGGADVAAAVARALEPVLVQVRVSNEQLSLTIADLARQIEQLRKRLDALAPRREG